jgi:FkbM family methyltransferase
MRDFSKLLRVLKTEGISGLRYRLVTRYYRVKLALAKRLGAKTIKSRYGPVFMVNFDDATFRYYILGKYGYFYWNELKSVARPFVLLDIGANQGLYSLGAASNPLLVHAYAFEPVQETSNLLSANIDINGYSQRITVIAKAVHDSTTTISLSRTDGHSGGASISKKKPQGVSSKTELIETVCGQDLDSLISSDDCAVYVKIDVEGHEEIVIKELMKTRLSSRIVHIFYEVNENWVDSEGISNLLENERFLVKRLGAGLHYDVVAVR